jgi:hypothetical protein
MQLSSVPIGLSQKKVYSYWQIASLAHFFSCSSDIMAVSVAAICSLNVPGARSIRTQNVDVAGPAFLYHEDGF